MDAYKPRFDMRSAADWLAEADHFDRMAEQFKDTAELSRGFRELATEARRRAAQSRG